MSIHFLLLQYSSNFCESTGIHSQPSKRHCSYDWSDIGSCSPRKRCWNFAVYRTWSGGFPWYHAYSEYDRLKVDQGLPTPNRGSWHIQLGWYACRKISKDIWKGGINWIGKEKETSWRERQKNSRSHREVPSQEKSESLMIQYIVQSLIRIKAATTFDAITKRIFLREFLFRALFFDRNNLSLFRKQRKIWRLSFCLNCYLSHILRWIWFWACAWPSLLLHCTLFFVVSKCCQNELTDIFESEVSLPMPLSDASL